MNLFYRLTDFLDFLRFRLLFLERPLAPPAAAAATAGSTGGRLDRLDRAAACCCLVFSSKLRAACSCLVFSSKLRAACCGLVFSPGLVLAGLTASLLDITPMIIYYQYFMIKIERKKKRISLDKNGRIPETVNARAAQSL